MATIYVELSSIRARNQGQLLPVADSADIGSDKKATTGTSQLSDLTGQLGQFWSVSAIGGNLMIEFGPGTPQAVDDGSRLLKDGETRDFAVSSANERLAFKDAV